MADTVIDTLSVKITANAQTASAALKSLTTALQRVRTALTGVKDGITVSESLSKSLTELNESLNSINTGSIKKLQKLANALNAYTEALKRLKAESGGASGALKTMSTAMSTTGGGSESGSRTVPRPGRRTVPRSMATSSGGTSRVRAAKEAVKELGEEVEKSGKKAKKAESMFGGFLKAIGRIALYRAIRAAIKAITEAFEEGLKNAYHYSEQSETFKRLAEALDHVKSITVQMQNQIGAMYGELKQALLPVVEYLVEMVRKLAENITQMLAALNGKPTYQRALLEEQKWDEATDAVKKYKQQLLGLDELNNLSARENGGRAGTDYSLKYEEVAVDPQLMAMGEKWQEVTGKISEAIKEIRAVIDAALVVIGAILLFSGVNIPLGLGLIVAGLYDATEHYPTWDAFKKELEDAMREYWSLFVAGSILMLVVGAGLLFTGHYLVGLGLIYTGLKLGEQTMNAAWDLMYNDISGAMQQYRWLFIAGAIGLVVVGSILLFTGHFLTGLSCILAGGVIAVETIQFSWTQLYADVQTAFQRFGPLFAIIGLGSMVVGALLLFTGHIGLGLALLIGGGFLAANAIKFNWDDILEGLKGAWENIKNWWNDTVVGSIKKAVDWVKDQFKFSFGDKTSNSVAYSTGIFDEFEINVEQGGTADKILSTLGFDKKGPKTSGSTSTHRRAMGGVPTQGTLFYAGEAGAEFVGNIGNSAAVANTQQMTEAIFNAAYMGMSKALQENGGNGMSGYEPATMDDLFIVFRKKANEYTRMTGNPAY